MLIILLWNCGGKKNPMSPETDEYTFAIYFLQNENFKMADVYESDLNKLKLASKPWLTENDIRFYDWSSHSIYLKRDKTHFFPNWENNKVNEFPPGWADKPFVVVANGNRCYMGYFFSLLSHLWIAPNIWDFDNSKTYPSDVLFIDWMWLYHDYPQNNPDVKDALINVGLYHGGISVTFDTTDVILNIENADTSTITYKFTITNNDENDLYIFDPENTGSSLFHYYTNGPVFKNLESGKLYESRWKTIVKPPSQDYWSPDWFIKLKSGHSIKRTVSLKGYPYFPTGEYIFQFKYNGPRKEMEREVREIADGRYWLGPTRSNILVFNFKATDNLSPVIQKIVKKNNRFLNEFLLITSTQQEFGLERR